MFTVNCRSDHFKLINLGNFLSPSFNSEGKARYKVVRWFVREKTTQACDAAI